MFDRLKNLFRKRAAETEVAEAPPQSFAPREFRPGYAPGEPITEPQPAAASEEPVAQVEETPAEPGTNDFVQIPLRPILLKLPDSLKGRVRQPPAPNTQITVPLQKILSQLAQGSVKMSFGELRQAAPASVFTDSNDQDQTLIELPLATILTQLKPEQLPRRTSQKKIEVPDEVTSLFGDKGEALTTVRMSTTSSKPPPPAPFTPAIPASAGPAPTLTPAPLIAPPGPPIKPVSPLTDAPVRPSVPLPSLASLKPPAAPAAPVAPPPGQPIKPALPLPPAPVAAPRLTVSMPVVPAHSPAATPAAAPVLAPPTSGVSLESLSVPLASIIAGWPETIRMELPATPDAMLALPGDETEQALKRGKIAFAWKRVRAWIKPPPSPTAASDLDETLLELPLSIIAPIFLQQKKPAAPQKKYDVTEHIPDLFTGKGTVPAAPIAAPGMPADVPISPPAPSPVAPITVTKAPAQPAPAPMAIAPSALQEIGEVFGQPGRKNWSPSELVQRTSTLKGVAGALIAMQDGLMVASHLPPGLNGETIAAFLPQMYSRIMQYSKELKFGEANNFTVIVDNVPLRIFKAGGVFFTVLGRAGESLPEPHLSIVAAQLGPQNK